MMSESSGKKGAVVDGFYFPDNPEAEQAKKEKEGIRFIREKSAMDGPEAVLKLYNRMIQQNLFETAVGYTYLKDLQEYLLSVPEISREDILPIRVRHPVSVREAAQQKEGGKAPEKNKEEKEKRQESEGGEAFLDSVIMYEVLSELKDIAARGGVKCACGSPDYGVRVGYSSVDLVCAQCGAALRLGAATPDDLDALCARDTLTIPGKKE